MRFTYANNVFSTGTKWFDKLMKKWLENMHENKPMDYLQILISFCAVYAKELFLLYIWYYYYQIETQKVNI